MAIFFCAATVAGAFSGLLAYGIQFMSGTAGRNGWEWVWLLPAISDLGQVPKLIEVSADLHSRGYLHYRVRGHLLLLPP